MADVMRWRYGETNPVLIHAARNSVIEIGDLVYLSWDGEGRWELRPASQLPRRAYLENLQVFGKQFAGVAMMRKRIDEDKMVRVATTGVFEFEMLYGKAEVGDRFVPMHGVNRGLRNQQVTRTEFAELSIGSCVRRVDPADTRVRLEIAARTLPSEPPPRTPDAGLATLDFTAAELQLVGSLLQQDKPADLDLYRAVAAEVFEIEADLVTDGMRRWIKEQSFMMLYNSTTSLSTGESLRNKLVARIKPFRAGYQESSST